jgi:methylated-DNA-protein-cysteine methyltransferase-like protein
MDFKEAVWKLVQSIPVGRVMTYGQIAGLMGRPRAAQYVGWVLHWSDPGTVPYQRVVNRFGGLADGYTSGGRLAHQKDLESEGVEVRDDMTVDLDKYLWHPNPEQVPSVTPGDISSNLPYTIRSH